jgi:hypothetical protein
MSSDHIRVAKWNTNDLLWEYLHQKAANHAVYKIVLNPVHTNPNNDELEKNSKIPWNQRSRSFIEYMKHHGIPEKNAEFACGSAVKIFLQKYMKTYPAKGEPWVHPFYKTPVVDPVPPRLSGKTYPYGKIEFNMNKIRKGIDNIKKLLAKGIAVRIPLIHKGNDFILDVHNKSQIAAQHYVGIVGYDGSDTFLYIDPWPGFSGIYTSYAVDSKFLGEMKYDGHFLKCFSQGLARDCVAIAAPTWVNWRKVK